MSKITDNSGSDFVDALYDILEKHSTDRRRRASGARCTSPDPGDVQRFCERRTKEGVDMIVRAQVRVTVEVTASSTWTPTTTSEQIFKQAEEDALQALRRGLVLHSMTSGKDLKTLGRIVGDPKVTIVMADEPEERRT